MDNQADSASKLCVGGFIDEMDPDMTRAAPLAAALGLRWACVRFTKPEGAENPVPLHKLTTAQVQVQRRIIEDAGLKIRTAGTGICKELILGPEAKVPWQTHLDEVVKPSIENSVAFGAQILRGFAGYHQEGRKFSDDIGQIADQQGQIAELLSAASLVMALENERGLGCQTGDSTAAILERVNHPRLGACWDGGNIVGVGFLNEAAKAQFIRVGKWIFIIHGKDIHNSDPEIGSGKIVHESKLTRFVPVGVGVGGYKLIFPLLAEVIKSTNRRLTQLGLEPGLPFDLEPHEDDSEQFYGETTPRNYRLAVQGVKDCAEEAGLETDLVEEVAHLAGPAGLDTTPWTIKDLMATWN